MYGLEALLAGRTLVDRYRIEEVIGRGGMGAVYRARDQRLGRAVAVKVISVPPVDPESHERLRARFHREARAAAGLHHPHVVAVYDFGTDPDLQLDFLVMELLRGEDLAARLSRKGPPAVPTALEILHQAARGLAAGHRAGLIHRDVKPGNLYLEPGDRPGEVQVRVLDFGIAEIAAGEESTMTHLTVAGRSPFSPAYASPEQLRGDARLGPATDVFSLGAVGFHLLTGKRAYLSADAREMLVELSGSLAAELPRVRGLSPAAREVLQRALAVDPDDRFPHAGALAEAIAPLVGYNPSREGFEAEEEDSTLFAPPEPAPLSRPRTTSRTAVEQGTEFLEAPPRRNGGAEVDGWQSRAPAPRQPPSAPPLPPPREGWFRRAARTTWNVLVTTVALAAFAGAWFLCVTGLRESDLQLLYAGAVTSVVLTPFAIHRVLGSRGSYRFALFGSILGSLGVVYLLTREHDAGTATVIGAMFLAQVASSLVAEVLTSRRPERGAEAGM